MRAWDDGRGGAADPGGSDDGVEAVLGRYDRLFDAAWRAEQSAYADALVEERERRSTLRDLLLERRHGAECRVRLRDGHVLRGRVVAVGADWVRIVDGRGPGGLGAGAVYDVAIDAVAAIGQVRR